VDQALFECPVRARVPSYEPSALEPVRPSSRGGRVFEWIRRLLRPADSAPRRLRLSRGVIASVIAAALGGWLLYHGEAVLSAATRLERSLAALFSWITGTTSTGPVERSSASASDIAPAAAPATTTASPATSSTPNAAARSATIAPATASLEIAALAALRRIDADLGEEVRVQRANGRLSITGIVTSAGRRAQILSVLASVRRDPAARVRIETLDEVHARGRARGTSVSTPTPAQDDAGSTGVLSFAPARIALHDEIRSALIASGVPSAIADDEVARSADRIVRRAQAMRLHAWALRRVLDGVPASEADTMSDDARAQWRELIREHARAFLDETTALSALARPVLATAAETLTRGDVDTRDDATRSGGASNGGTSPSGARHGATRDGSTRDGSTRAGGARDGSTHEGSTRDGNARGGTSAGGAGEGERALDADLLRVRGRALVESAARLDALVQAAFMLPANGTNGAPSVASSPGALLRSLHQASAAASALERAARPLAFRSSRP
jgi:hypothetical protein